MKDLWLGKQVNSNYSLLEWWGDWELINGEGWEGRNNFTLKIFDPYEYIFFLFKRETEKKKMAWF